jgi:uncharacterized protein involved in type VI secretion and phage assembly
MSAHLTDLSPIADAAQALQKLTSRLDFAQLLDERGRLIKLQTALPALSLIAERLVLKESVAQPAGASDDQTADFGWQMHLDALSTSRHFELKQLIGEQITVRLLQADGSYAPWHGYVFEAAQLGADGGLARYRLTMRPWLALLALRQDCYAWQDQTAADIVTDLFADYGRVPARGVSPQPRRAEVRATQRATAGSRVGTVSLSVCRPSSCM